MNRLGRWAVGVLVVCCAAAACGSAKRTISVVNRAEEPILRGMVRMAGHTMEIMNLGPSQTVTGSYDVTKDDHLSIEVVFQSGKRLIREIGSCQLGCERPDTIDLDDLIVVTESAIDIHATH